jgi:hypothetical protein
VTTGFFGKRSSLLIRLPRVTRFGGHASMPETFVVGCLSLTVPLSLQDFLSDFLKS